MAAAKVYTINKALWESAMDGPPVKDDVNITTITSHSFSAGGPVQTFHSDGDIYAQFAWMENIETTVDLTFTDYSLFVGTHNLEINDVGLLTLQFPELDQGAAGKKGGANLTLKAICGNDGSTQDDGCIIVGRAPSAGQAGISEGTVKFAMNSVDGATSPIQISMATLA